MEPQKKGDLTEAVVIAELKRRAIPVSIPFGNNERYDVIIEMPRGRLLKVQIKTGWFSDGKVTFKGYSLHTNSTGNVHKRYEGDVDYFLVYCHELTEMYLVREDEFEMQMSLRVEQPKQVHETINWADDYEFDARWPPN